jgi:hypothetical protein
MISTHSQKEVIRTETGEFLTTPDGKPATPKEIMRYARSIPAWVIWADRGIP